MSESDSMPIRVGDSLVWQSAVPHVIFAQRIPQDDPIVVEYDLSTSRGDSTIRLRCHYSEALAARDGITGLLVMPDRHNADLPRWVYGRSKAKPAPDNRPDRQSVGDIHHRQALAEALAELRERAAKIGAVWSKRLRGYGLSLSDALDEYLSKIVGQIAENDLADSEAIEFISGFDDRHIKRGLSRVCCKLRGFDNLPPSRERLSPHIAQRRGEYDDETAQIVEAICPKYRPEAWAEYDPRYPRTVSRQALEQSRRANASQALGAVIGAILDMA